MKVRSKLFWLYVVLAIIYASVNLVFAPPRNSLQHYHVSSATLRLLDYTVVGPVILVWFIGLYGYQRLQAYASAIRGNTDGRHVADLARGTLFLTLWLPVNSTLSTSLSWIGLHDDRLVPTLTIFGNYLNLLLPLIAFVYIGRGARGFSVLAKQRLSWRAMNVMALILVLIGIFYTYLVAQPHAHLHQTYHLSTAAVLLTIVAPYIFAWYLGLFAAYELHLYTFKVQGVIYKSSWNLLAVGVSWIILFSICLQYITVVTAKYSSLPLSSLLVLIYGTIAALAIGYILIARGAKKLTRIEEV